MAMKTETRMQILGNWISSSLALIGFVVLASAATANSNASWEDYHDYAYVFSSSDAAALDARLDGYASEIGISLDAWVKRSLEDLEAKGGEEKAQTRRRATAQLLQYLATRGSK